MPKKNKNEKYFEKKVHTFIYVISARQRGSEAGRRGLGAAAGCVLYMQYIKLCILYAYIGVHFYIYTAGCCPLVMCIHIGVHFLKILPAFIVSG
nr:MAG TPA: hypothetical protein [Caudoviricetes sp.]